MAQLRPVALRGGLSSEQEFDELTSWVVVNDAVDVAFMTISTWGRKASGPAKD